MLNYKFDVLFFLKVLFLNDLLFCFRGNAVSDTIYILKHTQ
jgi:hypothetical protein